MRGFRLVLLVLLVVAGCSLPLPSGVRSPSGTTASQQQAAGVEVLPQGPTADQTQVGAVVGFLAAQASPLGDYAIARQFLTSDLRSRWAPESGIRVYRPESEVLKPPTQRLDPPEAQSVRVALDVVGAVDSAGHYVPTPGHVVESYGITRTPDGWRVSSLPPSGYGLQLSLVDLQRTFAARNVYYVAHPVPGVAARHLAADRVFLPSQAGDAELTTLVRRALEPPSSALQDAVDPVLPGVTAERVTRSRTGVVTVTLAPDANDLGGRALRDLSARLVWTLKSGPQPFTGLRLRTAARLLRPQGSPDVQPANAWPDYDPEGTAEPPYFFVTVSGHPRSSGSTLPAALLDSVVERIVVSPRGDRVATLRRTRGRAQVMFGSLGSAVTLPGAQAPDLRSPTWGSGEAGLWLVSSSRRVLRLVPGEAAPRGVPTPGLPAGRISSLAVARDGTRAALVVGGEVYVAKVIWTSPGAPTLQAFTPLRLPTPSPPTQVVWSTSTELVLLRPDPGARAVVRVAVDGSASTVVLTGRLVPTDIAAAGTSLVVAASDHALYSVSQGITKVQSSATAPAFPG